MGGSSGRRGLELVPIGGVGEGLLEPLGRELDRRFGTRSFRGPPLPLREAWRDPATGQYRSGDLVDALIARVEALGRADDGSLWSLGITEAELGAPGRSFVFGEATVGGCCAVVGLARLDAGEGAGVLLLRRLLTEAVHELGHVAGLEHCPDPCCVMHPSETVEETDRKESGFCPACASVLARSASARHA